MSLNHLNDAQNPVVDVFAKSLNTQERITMYNGTGLYVTGNMTVSGVSPLTNNFRIGKAIFTSIPDTKSGDPVTVRLNNQDIDFGVVIIYDIQGQITEGCFVVKTTSNGNGFVDITLVNVGLVDSGVSSIGITYVILN
jgi:hypothetical protein